MTVRRVVSSLWLPDEHWDQGVTRQVNYLVKIIMTDIQGYYNDIYLTPWGALSHLLRERERERGFLFFAWLILTSTQECLGVGLSLTLSLSLSLSLSHPLSTLLWPSFSSSVITTFLSSSIYSYFHSFRPSLFYLLFSLFNFYFKGTTKIRKK